MPDACPRCLMTFPQHLVVRATCSKRWRGHNFDAANAEGAVGAAVAGVLGMPVRTTADLEAFLRRAFVRCYGEGLDLNPASTFDASEGERFEFHVGLRQAVDEATFERVRDEAAKAVSLSRHFSLA